MKRKSIRVAPLARLCRPSLPVLAAGLLFVGPARQAPAPPEPRAIVVGFLGGALKHDDRRRNEVLLAERLHREFPAAIVRVFENAKGKEAHALIRRELAETDSRRARIVLYGHSWGGSEAVALARKLASEGIPVLLTVQVDSVEKLGQNDASIPPNVAEAVNFYQTDGWLHGRRRIVPEDAERTTVLGNFRMNYHGRAAGCRGYPWVDKAFAKTHSEIECDPSLWKRIELLIRPKLGPAGAAESRPLN
jgi:pimeloyl-ACP methyl ester carboxylesterase